MRKATLAGQGSVRQARMTDRLCALDAAVESDQERSSLRKSMNAKATGALALRHDALPFFVSLDWSKAEMKARALPSCLSFENGFTSRSYFARPVSASSRMHR